MSLSQSLNAAVSGLTAASRGAEVVANNIANKDLKSYGKRTLDLSTAVLGGVRVEGVLRQGNTVVIGERRIAQAELAATGTLLTFHSGLEGWLGLPGDEGALGSRIDRLEAALTTAAAMPQSEAHLASVLDSAQALAGGLRQISGQIQQARQQADSQIGSQVAEFNDALARVAELNRTIVRMAAQGQDVSGLVDQRQALVDQIAGIVPLREIQRDGGQIVLYSAGGATLLDGQPAVLSIQPAGVIRAESGPLPGLVLNGQPVTGGALEGGSLAANLALRDEVAPAAQARLDGLARNLIGRLQAADPTLAAGAPGLFTDAGLAFAAADEQGIAARITVNALVDPAQGGQLWRLRAGLGAATPGEVGNGAMFTRLAATLSEAQVPLSGNFGPGAASLSGLAGQLLSSVSAARLTHQSAASFAASRTSALEQFEAASGVDSDQELQILLRIETAYAANARVISAVDHMLATLLEI